MRKHCSLIIGLVACAFILAQGAIGQTARGPLRPEGVAMSDADTPQPVRVMVGKKDVPAFRIAPPANFAAQPKTSTFTIEYLNAGEVNYFGDVCVGWPEDAKAAFTYAANIWGTLLNSSVPIKISACWANMGTGGILGHGGARTYYKDFTGAIQADTYFPIAIANALYGSDLNGGTEEIVIAYNAQFTDWYFGTGTCPANKIDFVQVIMHEMCHGLGFIGSMNVDGGLGTWGLGGSGIPTIYDRFTEDVSGTKLIAYASGSSALASQLTSGNVYFNGANANAGNGGAKVKLYAPSTWSGGSSYAHLDEIFNGTVNAMMTYSVDYAETIHDPGPITMGILKDNGWSGATPPVQTGPVIKANGIKGAITVNYPETVSVTVEMNAGNYAGIYADWWIIGCANGAWYYLNGYMQWIYFNGYLGYCRPVNQGPLFNLTPKTVLSMPLPPGTHYFWFGVDTPINGILNLDNLLYDQMTVTVQ